MPSVMVTESTLSVVSGGIAEITAGSSHSDGPLSRAFIKADATMAGLPQDRQVDRVRHQRAAVADEGLPMKYSW